MPALMARCRASHSVAVMNRHRRCTRDSSTLAGATGLDLREDPMRKLFISPAATAAIASAAAPVIAQAAPAQVAAIVWHPSPSNGCHNYG
jgi:hypothetical protein